MIKIAIDRGGTFTDLFAIIDDKTIITKKILSESSAYDDPNSYAIQQLLQELGRSIEDVEWIRLGTTVATNALLEGKGVDLSLMVTEGFKDLLQIGYQDRPDLFALEITKPEPLYKEVIEVQERLDADGSVVRALQEIPTPSYDNVAVVLLHAYKNDAHERAIKEHLKDREVVISSEVISLPKAIDRASSTVVDAYLTPVVRDYVERIAKRIPKEKIRFIKSDGGLCAADEFRGINSLLSGPAGGVVALGGIYEAKPLIGFDMGGTSTDVSRYDGRIELRYESSIARRRILYPMVDIHTVAAGGGSRLFYKNEMFVVGPQSSGSDPGPVCYGKGGYLSVTDANLVTGRLDPKFLPKIFGPDGDRPLDERAAYEAFEPIAKEVGASVEEVAEAFLDVANEEMANAIKEITIKKGYDPKEHVLCVFGGAGAQHAVGVARKLSIEEIFIHRYGGILSAVGIAQALESGELLASADGDIETTFEELLKRVPPGFESERFVFVKVSGTNTALEVPYENYDEHFREDFKRLYGFLPQGAIQIERIKVRYYKQEPPLRLPKLPKGSAEAIGTKRIFLDGRFVEAHVYKDPPAGAKILGPALIVLKHTTVVLDEASQAYVDEYGHIRIRLAPKGERTELEAARLSLLANRLTFVAKKMGDVLQKAAKSVNIKERADFSCAIFDAQGNLIVNAPHIPVHLGSMSSVIKSLIAKGYEDATYITNAPYEGGSHLPDITVVTPYIEDGETIFWVASRGHHADIGGIVPGSMPPFSKWLAEEGAVIEAFPVLKDGIFNEERLREILRAAGGRAIEDNISDIKAQIAANMEGIKGVLQIDRSDLLWFFERIQRVSQKKTAAFLEAMGPVEGEDRLDNGAVIAFCTYKENGCYVFDFSRSSPQLFGNQNTPLAVVRSAVLYALRVMLGEDIPLNEGILEAIELRVPRGTILDPDPELAIVGGNVTTSQRIVDVILHAFGVAANSQGCMNNVIFGNEEFGYYETICGGAGATPKAPGADAVHTHMTNTRITDTEIIERRYSVRIEEFSLRRGSGGAGKHRGGDGAVRKYRFLDEVEVSLLTERRTLAPRGLAGGGSGARGRNYLVRGGRVFELGGKNSFRAQKGDLLVIETPGGGGWGKI